MKNIDYWPSDPACHSNETFWINIIFNTQRISFKKIDLNIGSQSISVSIPFKLEGKLTGLVFINDSLYIVDENGEICRRSLLPRGVVNILQNEICNSYNRQIPEIFCPNRYGLMGFEHPEEEIFDQYLDGNVTINNKYRLFRYTIIFLEILKIHNTSADVLNLVINWFNSIPSQDFTDELLNVFFEFFNPDGKEKLLEAIFNRIFNSHDGLPNLEEGIVQVFEKELASHAMYPLTLNLIAGNILYPERVTTSILVKLINKIVICNNKSIDLIYPIFNQEFVYKDLITNQFFQELSCSAKLIRARILSFLNTKDLLFTPYLINTGVELLTRNLTPSERKLLFNDRPFTLEN